MGVGEGRAVLGSGVLHIHNTEWAATETTPNIWFGPGNGFSGEPVVISEWPGGVAVEAYLNPRDRYAGIQSFDYEGRAYKLYCVIDRVTELMGGPFYQVTFSLTEG